jgi:hypothetical protein
VVVGEYHIEIVAKDTAVEVHITDSLDRPLKASGFKALAIMVIDGKTHRIPMEPTADELKFTALVPAVITRMRGAVQLTDNTSKTTTGRVN